MAAKVEQSIFVAERLGREAVRKLAQKPVEGRSQLI